jgi:profilin
MAVRVDSEQVIGRKGQRGVFIIPTQQAILIAEVSQGHLCTRRCTDQQYDEPIQAAETSVVASKLAEYLTGVGY